MPRSNIWSMGTMLCDFIGIIVTIVIVVAVVLIIHMLTFTTIKKGMLRFYRALPSGRPPELH